MIGADGFGMAWEEGRWLKIPQIGRVLIGDHVEVGANTTIDRGALDDTVIEEDVKLDNQIQVAHNVRIGAHTAIAGCVGIAGSATIGKYCRIGGSAGILGHLSIADGVEISSFTLVSKSIREKGVYSGIYPFSDKETWLKNAAHLRHLDDMFARIKQLEKEIEIIKGRENMSTAMDIHEVLEHLPHRYPFLLIDRVLEVVPNESIVALKNVSMNEPFFPGHYPHHPVMPGVLVIEAMAQAAAILSFKTMGTLAERRFRVLLRRHRQRALQTSGRPRRPVDPEGVHRDESPRHVEIQRQGRSGRTSCG